MQSIQCILLLCLALMFITHLRALGDDVVQKEGGALMVVETDEDDDGEVTSFEEDIGYDPDIPVLVATSEWQTVKEGQRIPPGLHVRINLQTGQKEAKLLDGEDNNAEAPPGDSGTAEQDPMQSRMQAMKEAIEEAMRAEDDEGEENHIEYWKHGDQEGMKNTRKTDFTVDELKEALKKYKHEKDDVQDEKLREESVRKRFRSMQELQQEMERLELTVKTDLEIVTELLRHYRDPELTLGHRLHLLGELEYHVHQIDNAQNVADMGGLDLVIMDLNHTNEAIRSEAAFVIGSAVQSNPKVQIRAIEGGAMQRLIRMLSRETSTKVVNRVLYALSSLLRHFPYAQQRFLKLGGLQGLSDLLTGTAPDTSKLKVKAVTLINDLLLEKMATENAERTDPGHEEKMKQYQKIPLLKSILEQGWCQLVPGLLSLQEHDSREKVLTAMTTLLDPCHVYFWDVQELLLQLRTEYETLASQEARESSAGEDLYFGGLLHTIDNLLSWIPPGACIEP